MSATTDRTIRYTTRRLLLATGILSLVLTSCGFSGARSEDVEAIKTHVDRSFGALARGDLAELVKIAPEFQEFDESALRMISENFVAGVSWSIDEVKIKGKTARVTVVFTGGDDSLRSELDVTLEQSGDEWRFGGNVAHEQRYDFVPID